ncbi:MAG: hypothetical protein WD512_03085 [Candidatus Paceibacterota bacterium]
MDSTDSQVFQVWGGIMLTPLFLQAIIANNEIPSTTKLTSMIGIGMLTFAMIPSFPTSAIKDSSSDVYIGVNNDISKGLFYGVKLLSVVVSGVCLIKYVAEL